MSHISVAPKNSNKKLKISIHQRNALISSYPHRLTVLGPNIFDWQYTGGACFSAGVMEVKILCSPLLSPSPFINYRQLRQKHVILCTRSGHTNIFQIRKTRWLGLGQAIHLRGWWMYCLTCAGGSFSTEGCGF